MRKHTLVVSNTTAYGEARLRAARARSSGLQIFILHQLAERLAGGFIRLAAREVLIELVGEALREGAFRQLQRIARLPGMARAVTTTLQRAWSEDLDLQALADSAPRCSDLAWIESRVLRGLPANMRVSRDLVSEAESRLSHGASIFGAVRTCGLADLNRCWRRLVVGLANALELEYNVVPGVEEDLSWLEGTQARIVRAAPHAPEQRYVVCANPRHEVLEALRWARELMAVEGVPPQEIAIVSVQPERWDDYVRTWARVGALPVYFAHGLCALSTAAGQEAAALANLLLRGLSKERFLRLTRLCAASGSLSGLTGNWHRILPPDAPLLGLAEWRRALGSATESRVPQAQDLRTKLLPVLELLDAGTDAAKEVGEAVLSSQALALWQRALVEGPAAALETTLAQLRIPDERDPGASVLWGSDRDIVGVPRGFVRLLGMERRGWPRSGGDDAILPDHVLAPGVLSPIPVGTQDRRSLDRILATTPRCVVYSRSRRDREGRLLGASTLIPAGLTPEMLKRTRIPGHALTESDRLAARSSEFEATPLARSAETCWSNWRASELTSHDGVVRPNHPVINSAIGRVHSATSLRKLLRDPLGFVWTYCLGWRVPEYHDEPLRLDPAPFGKLVHEILEETVRRLEYGVIGFAGASSQQIARAVAEVTGVVAERWQVDVPIPPRIIWQQSLERAQSMAREALSFAEPAMDGQRSWVEIPFGPQHGQTGRVEAEMKGRSLPWSRNTKVMIPGTGIEIAGRIDRLDLDASGVVARISDYKTGKVPDGIDDLSIDGGKELQRCLYSFAAKAILPRIEKLEARLIYPGAGGGIFPLNHPKRCLDLVTRYLEIGIANLQSGNALPGPSTGGAFYDLHLALPANADGQYLVRKREAAFAAQDRLELLWTKP